MLDEPISQNALGKFAAKIQVLDIFMCWIDIQEYKNIPTISYRRSKALHIFQKYIKEDAVLMVGVTTPQERQRISEDLRLSKDDPYILTPSFFDSLQSKCFLDMYHNIYLPFKQTEECAQLNQQLKDKYNKVKLTDFEYFTKLGEGGFGFVVHCKKKSTGKHYAMKIQTKHGLLDSFKDDPHKVSLEKDVIASLQHPFIVNLYYAFQTPSLAIMVLDLADAGDLHSCLAHAQHNRLPEDRVRFYIGEISLALGYLHQRGLIYRDLKPQNVLLNSDGHVQLVDMGGIMDDQGNWTQKQQSHYKSVLPLFSPQRDEPTIKALGVISEANEDDQLSTRQETSANDSMNFNSPQRSRKEDFASSPSVNKKNKPKRKQSIMGTIGYMAPEMVLLLSRPPMYGESAEKHATRRQIKKGYTYAVDWWSLGVTAYKLLTGSRPFGDHQMHQIVEVATTLNQVVGENMHFREYAMLFQKLQFPPYISQAAQDFVTRLLNVDDEQRLGAGENGIQEVKQHEFFQGMDWDSLEQKQIPPPYMPYGIDYYDGFNPVPDLRTLLATYDKEHYLDDAPDEMFQKYFEHWDFISPHTLRVEAGLSHMMEQLVTNMKARRIMGESESRKPEKGEKLSEKLFAIITS